MRVSDGEVQSAVSVLRRGGIVAFPTETYYGLAVDPFNREALQRLFEVKKREVAKPVLTLAVDRTMISLLAAEMPPQFLPLMDAFWPGPLTLLFKALDSLPTLLTAGTGTVGIRISSHPMARLLTESFGAPITATSANISGRPPAEDAGELALQFKAGIDAVLDCGKTPARGPSTVVGLDNGELQLIRAGVIPFAEILAVNRG